MKWSRWSVRPALVALGLSAALFVPPAVRSWDRIDFLVSSDTAENVSVASSDGLDAIVAWSVGHPSGVRYRAMQDRVWLGDLIDLGAGSDPRVLVDLLGTFHLMYVSGSSIVNWAGAPGAMEGPGFVSAGTEPIEGFSVSMAPDGTISLVWQQGDLLWWTTDVPDYDGWSLPYQSTPLTGSSAHVVPRLIGGAWQPRIYCTSPGSEGLFWRDYDGAGWGPDVPVPLRVPAYGGFEVVLLGDGRHALFYGDAEFCGNYYYEEDGSGTFLEQPALWTFGGGPCHISDFVPMPIAATVDGIGRLHAFRYEACFEYHDYDLWGCSFRLIWQWWSPALGEWIYASADEFPGGDAYSLSMVCPHFSAGTAVFAWTAYSSVMLRIMSPSGTSVAEAEDVPPWLCATPSPSAGSVCFRWTAPLAADGAGLQGPSVLQIFDVRGRLCRAFRIDASRPGQFVWDGRDDRGTPAASGAYFSRILDGRQRRNVPIVWVR